LRGLGGNKWHCAHPTASNWSKSGKHAPPHNGHRTNEEVIPTKTINHVRKEEKDRYRSSRQSRKKDKWVKWITCTARLVILDDLWQGALLDGVSADAAFKFFKKIPEFKEVCFKQFKACLKDHQKQASKQWFLNAEEEKSFEHDMKLYPNSQTQNKQGKLIFDTSLVKLLLHEDVKDKKHEGVLPSQFQGSRPELQAL
jgi:hypothetical protein